MTVFYLYIVLKIFFPVLFCTLYRLLLTGDRGSLPSQWETIFIRYEDYLPVRYQAAENRPGRGP